MSLMVLVRYALPLRFILPPLAGLFLLHRGASGMSGPFLSSHRPQQPADALHPPRAGELPLLRIPFERRAAWTAFQAEHGSVWRSAWDPDTGILIHLFGGRIESRGPEMVSAGRTFLNEVSGLTGVTEADVEFRADREHLGVHVVSWAQKLGAREVFGAIADLTMTPEGAIIGFHSSCAPLPPVAPVLPPLPKSEFTLELLSAFGGSLPSGITDFRAVPVYFPDRVAKVLVPAWDLRFRTTYPFGDWTAVHDERDGRLLLLVNHVRTAAPAAKGVGRP